MSGTVTFANGCLSVGANDAYMYSLDSTHCVVSWDDDTQTRVIATDAINSIGVGGTLTIDNVNLPTVGWGYFVAGQVILEDDASLTIGDLAIAGGGADYPAEFDVNAGSSVTVLGSVYVGYAGTGSLQINGGSVQLQAASLYHANIYVGYYGSGSLQLNGGSVELSGASSSNSGNVYVGYDAAGSLQISDGNLQVGDEWPSMNVRLTQQGLPQHASTGVAADQFGLRGSAADGGVDINAPYGGPLQTFTGLRADGTWSTDEIQTLDQMIQAFAARETNLAAETAGHTANFVSAEYSPNTTGNLYVGAGYIQGSVSQSGGSITVENGVFIGSGYWTGTSLSTYELDDGSLTATLGVSLGSGPTSLDSSPIPRSATTR